MKSFICLFIVAGLLIFSSCDKNSEESVAEVVSPQVLISKAKKFSAEHDQLVYRMLSLDSQMLMQRVASDAPMQPVEFLDHITSVIHQSTGVKPVIADHKSQKVLSAVANGNSDYYWVNLDVEAISLASFSNSELGAQYMGVVDEILQSTSNSIEQKLIALEDVSVEVLNEDRLSNEELERVLTAVEVLKGSLALWSDVATDGTYVGFAPGVMKSQVKNWSFLKKLAFVSAADAVGGVLGFFLGGYITVNGIPIYLPAGGTGMVVSAAALSYIAAKMVGW
jgi:hypothetical protein